MQNIAPLLYALDLLILVAFQLTDRGPRIFAHPVSDYGIGPKARLFTVYMVLGSAAPLVLAVQFWQAGYPAGIALSLMVVMLGRIAIGVFPNDPKGAPRTLAGHIHHGATLVAFVAAFMVIAEATPILAGSAGPLHAITILVLKHAISLGFIAVVLTISPPFRQWFGLAERLFLYAAGTWCLIAALTLPPL
jgi:hypothetical membrane protein